MNLNLLQKPRSALEKGSCCQSWPRSLCPGLEAGQPRAPPAPPLRSRHTLSPRNGHHQPQPSSPSCRHVCSPRQGLVRSRSEGSANAWEPEPRAEEGTGRGHLSQHMPGGLSPREHSALCLCRLPHGPDDRGAAWSPGWGQRKGPPAPTRPPLASLGHVSSVSERKLLPGLWGARSLPQVQQEGPSQRVQRAGLRLN